MELLYCLVVSCLALFFMAIGCGMVGGGTVVLNNADAKDYRAAYCFVSSFSYRESRCASNNPNTGWCDFQLTTNLTANRAWDWCGNCNIFAEDVSICHATNCNTSCYVVYKSEASDAEPIEITMSSGEVIGTFFGLVLTAMGSMCFCLSCAACFCIRLMSLAQSNQGLVRNMEPTSVGVPQIGDAAYKKPPIDTAKFEQGMSGCFSFTGTLLTFVAVVGVIGGLYVAAVLQYFHNRELSLGGKVLPAEAATVGLGISGLCVVCMLLVWLGIYILKKKFAQLLEDFAANSMSEEHLQKMCAQKLIDKLNSKEGERYRKILLEAGIGEEQINRIVTAPPDQIVDEAMAILVGRVAAHIICTLGEEAMRPPFEDELAIYSFMFVGTPAYLVAVCLWLSAYCVEFTRPTVASVVSVLMMGSCVTLYLQWLKTYSFGFTALNFALWVAIFALWAQHSVTGLSVLLWLLSIPQFAVWLLVTFMWAWYVKPIAEALFEYVLEEWKSSIWRGFGCERDPELLAQRREELLNAGGFLGERLGVRDLAHQTE